MYSIHSISIITLSSVLQIVNNRRPTGPTIYVVGSMANIIAFIPFSSKHQWYHLLYPIVQSCILHQRIPSIALMELGHCFWPECGVSRRVSFFGDCFGVRHQIFQSLDSTRVRFECMKYLLMPVLESRLYEDFESWRPKTKHHGQSSCS